MAERESDPGLDEALKAAFESEHPESVLKKIEKLTGVKSRVLIHDDAEDPSPMIRVQGLESEAAEDDSRYQVVGEIARGGVGVVHKARDRDLGRDVALKVLRKDFADNTGVFARFIEEAQIGGQLQHPGIVPVYGMALQPDGRPSFAMKLIKGRTLAAALKERKSPTEDRRRFLAIFEQVSLTMGYAHARGVIHRDLKPSNILVGNFGEVMVVDWGFGKVLGRPEPEKPETTIVATVRSTGEGSESMAGSVMGTPAYMPPEQALGQVEEMDEQSDVFALGSILTEILTGKPAYAGESKDLLVLAAQAKLEDAFERLDQCEAEPPMVDLAKRCLANRRSARPDDAMAVAKEVGEHLTAAEERARKAELSAVEESARLDRETKQATYERKARRKVLALAACVLLAVLLGGGAWLKLDSDRRGRAAAARPAVEQAMEKATRLGGQDKWTEAIAVAKKAVALAEEADAETKDRAGGVLCDLEAGEAAAQVEAEQSRKDVALLASLEETRLRWGEVFRVDKQEQHIVDALGKWGLDLDLIDPADAGERVRSRGAKFSTEVAAALDDLVWLRREVLKLEPDAWEPLVALADVAAPDATHQRLRKSLFDRDRDALRQLASSEDVLRLPSRSLGLLGFGLWAVGEPRMAADLLRKALRDRPDDFSLLRLLGQTVKTLEPAEAIRCYTAALALRPESTHVRAMLAVLLDRNGRQDEAVEVLRDAIARDPGNVLLLTSIASLLNRVGKQEEALPLAWKTVSIPPKGDRDHRCLGKIISWRWLNKDTREETSAELSSAEACTALATGLWYRRRTDEAMRFSRKAISLDPEYPAAHYYLGLSLARKGRLHEAVESYREAIRLAPGVPSNAVMKDLAGALMRMGSLEESLEVYRDAIRTAPWQPDAYMNLGADLNRIGRRDEAMEVARQTIRLQPDNHGAYNNLAIALLNGGRVDQAIAAFRQSLEINPEYPNAHYSLGNALADKGFLDEAVEAYREAIRLRPGYADAHCNLGHRLREQGKFEEALVELRRGHELGGKMRGWRYPSGSWVAHAVRVQEIEQKLPDLLSGKLRPSNVRELQLFAYVCFCKKQYAAAAAFHREARTAAPDVTFLNLLAAASAAARAGCGHGVSPPPEADRPELRREALTWLREHLERLRNRRMESPLGMRDALVRMMIDHRLACVREEEALSLLPPSERDAWTGFWRDVEVLIEELRANRAIEHFSLGRVLLKSNLVDGAITALRVAVEIEPDWGAAQRSLGTALSQARRYEEAVETFRDSLRVEPDHPRSLAGLAVALSWSGRHDEAVETHRKMIALSPGNAGAPLDLAQTLRRQGKFEESIQVCRQAIRLQPNFGDAHFHLGRTLLRVGKIGEALTAFRQAAEFGSGPALWIPVCERLVELQPGFPAILSGEDDPANARERADFALLCFLKGRYTDSARLFHEAFDEDPSVAAEVTESRRMYAACAAIRAASGQGESPPADEVERGELRKRALEWLTADLAWFVKLPREEQEDTVLMLRTFLIQPDLAPVRDERLLGELPSDEREEWDAFWAEVREFIASATGGG